MEEKAKWGTPEQVEAARRAAFERLSVQAIEVGAYWQYICSALTCACAQAAALYGMQLYPLEYFTCWSFTISDLSWCSALSDLTSTLLQF